MSDTVINVENLSKKYIIGHQTEGRRYVALRDVLAEGTKSLVRRCLSPFKKVENGFDNSVEEFWALKDVSFEIREGDRVGIIGRNGAGKSTLLKILSRITEPSGGKVHIAGRVASLLEVGTGFHPELTGRENIYLNGAILGMSKSEIKKKFDEIVDFAEIERFLDTPVKRYSSGMYVRLAFAVAAHLEPEILLIDEVLAVGDVQFQKKCLTKMEEVSKEGRTILFVSHNMNAIEQFCNFCLLLNQGRIKLFNKDIRMVIKSYLCEQINGEDCFVWINSGEEFENPYFKPLKLSIIDKNGMSVNTPISNDSEIWIQIEGYIKEVNYALQIGYAIYSENGLLFYWTCNKDIPEKQWIHLEKGKYIFKSRFPSRLFNEGKYRVELLSAIYFREWLCEPTVNSPYIYMTIQGGLSESPYWTVKRPGLLAPVIEWSSIKI